MEICPPKRIAVIVTVNVLEISALVLRKAVQDMGSVVNKILDSSRRSTGMWYDPIIDEPVYLEDLNVSNNKGD